MLLIDADRVFVTKRVEIKIFGLVQGVFFRSFVREVALGLRLTGFARNELDGSVFIVAEGPEEKLRGLIARCREGPPAAIVEKVEVKWHDAKGKHKGFDIE